MSVLREVLATVRAQWPSSLAGAAIVAGMCAAMVLTQGAVVATRAQITSSLESEEARTIVVRAQEDAGIGFDVLDRLRGIDSITSALALGPAADVTNIALPGGEPVGMRSAGGLDVRDLGIAEPGVDSAVYLTATAARILGMDRGVGAVTGADGDHPVAGVLTLPERLEMLEPVALRPLVGESTATVAILVLLCDRFESVEPVVAAVAPILAAASTTSYSIETTSALSELAETIAVETSPGFRAISVGVFVVSSALVAILLTVLVTLRRRDFGRRRALGASQSYVLALVLGQGLVISALGAASGTVLAWAALLAAGRAVPPVGYVLGVAVLASVGGTISAILPAAIAARRDPARELRTP